MTWTRTVEKHNYEEKYNKTGDYHYARRAATIKQFVIQSVEYSHPQFPFNIICKMIQKTKRPFELLKNPVRLELILSYPPGTVIKGFESYAVLNHPPDQGRHTITRMENEKQVTYDEIYEIKECEFEPDKRDYSHTAAIHFMLIYYHYLENNSNVDFDLNKFFRIYKDEQDIYNKLLSYVNNNDFETAIEKANEFQNECYFEPIWQLAQFFDSNAQQEEAKLDISFAILEKIFTAISDKSPYFTEAQARLFEILTPIACHPGDTTFEKKFTSSLNSHNQPLTDRLFDQFCGNKNMSPSITNVGVNVKTLCEIATTMRLLNKQLEALRLENMELKSLKARIEAGRAAKNRDKQSTLGLFNQQITEQESKVGNNKVKSIHQSMF